MSDAPRANVGRLKRIVGGFRRGILGQRAPDMMCAAVCYPLCGYLAMCGIETKIVEGDFGRTNHVWLEMEDGTIIDPTADQFSGEIVKMPKVYIGPLPETYKRWMSTANVAVSGGLPATGKTYTERAGSVEDRP